MKSSLISFGLDPSHPFESQLQGGPRVHVQLTAEVIEPERVGTTARCLHSAKAKKMMM